MNFYQVEIKMNGEVFKKKGIDLDKTIMLLKPEFVLTQSFVTITYKKRVFERMLTLHQGRKLFNDETYREMFINNLI